MTTDDSQTPPSSAPPEPTADEVARCIEVMRAVEQLSAGHPLRRAVEAAASHVHRGAKKHLRRARARARRAGDRAVREELANAREEVAGVRHLLPASTGPVARTLVASRSCYVCKEHFTELHPLYLELCPPCARFNTDKRVQRVPLEGRRALVTGGRVKVGFQLALKLLRDGAHVSVTSRYPRDTVRRYAREPDFAEWRHRLTVYGLDLRSLPGTRAFIAHLLATEPHLDILVNNAAQTLRPVLEHDAALRAAEEELGRALEPSTLALLREVPGARPALEVGTGEALASAAGLVVRERADGSLEDERPTNSWVLRLDEVSTVELLEVQLVNAVAPFLLNGQLKPLLLRSPHPDRYIINVSAVEGQFQREAKTVFHPHTNMAKAALNMMTRTSAADYARDGIYMNSVDTGWLTNENPHAKRQRMEALGFSPPLDCVDGAARIYDAIAQGVRGQPVHGHFLKDYRSASW